MPTINDKLTIADDELEWSFVRSSGPGGQNVNKVASKAVLRWNIAASASLPIDIKNRAMAQQRRRITEGGDLLITSQRYRDQERNKEDCVEKLVALIVQAASVPKVRKAAKPTRASKERRLAAKRHRASAKSARQTPVGE